MKKLYLFLIGAILLSASTFAQTANYYNFSTSNAGTLDPMTGATTIVPANTDNDPSTVQTIPFSFLYEGRSYTNFSLTPDGFIKLGSGAAVAQPSNNIYSNINSPMIFPFWDNLSTGTNGSVSSVTTGTAPNRILKIQWFVTVPRDNAGNANSTMQVWLYESTNVIEFRYGAGVGPSDGASIGINGFTSTDFVSVTEPGNTSSNTTTNDNNTAWPGNGTLYSFTPPAVSACTRPNTQATSLLLPDETSSYIGGYFTAGTDNPKGYLVIRSSGAFTGTPVNGTPYSPDQTIGNGTVVQFGDALSFTANGLTGNSQYTITIFSYNSGLCSGGPIYNSTSPLTGSAQTCSSVPGSPASSVTATSAKLSWISSLGGGVVTVTYTVDVSKDNSFATAVTGSPFTVNDPTTTLNVTGLTENTVYYYRIKATGNCISTYPVYSFTTNCQGTSVPYAENFDEVTTPNIPGCSRVEDLNAGTTWTTVDAPSGYTGKILQYNYSDFIPGDDWFYTQGLNLTAGKSYTLGYKYGSDIVGRNIESIESMDVAYRKSASADSMNQSLASHPAIAWPVPLVNVVNFIPAETGTYFIGFHAYSQTGQGYLKLDSITVTPTAALPVTLVGFTAVNHGVSNYLSWSTSQEINTRSFDVEHSAEGVNFTAIGAVDAAGNSSVKRSYSFNDGAPLAGVNYYRLRIADKDNSIKYSDIISLKNGGLFAMTLYPNPVTDVALVKVMANKNDHGIISITDMNGKQVYMQQVSLTAGINKIPVKISNLSKGTYFIKVQSGDGVVVNKFAKL